MKDINRNLAKTVKVSVVVPVYNTEKYLEQCLDSILGQTLKEIEIICVDDGSTDTSPDILEEYAGRDSRVQVYHQENKYAGAARNLGKSHAIGEYLAFWDSDDFFEPEALELLYNKAKAWDADICVCGANKYFENRNGLDVNDDVYLRKSCLPKEEVFNRHTWPEKILNFTNATAWNKLFRQGFIEEIGLDFQEIRNGNDVYFTINAICLAERITTINRSLVHYRMNRSDGLVSTISRSPLSPVGAWEDIAKNLKKRNAFPERSFVNKAISSITYVLRNISEYSAFEAAVDRLKSEALKEMCITDGREDGFYDVKWYGEFVSRIWNDTAAELLAWLSCLTYNQLTEQTMEKQLAKTELKGKKSELEGKKAELKKKDAELEKKEVELKRKDDEIKAKNDEIKKKDAEFKKRDAEAKKKISALKKANEDIKNSRSYRIGRAITWLPRRVRDILKKRKKT